jgi:hypothetical protein
MNLVVLLLALCCAAGHCAEPAPPTVETLIGELDAEQFDTRRRATEQLVKIGEAALPLLKETLQKTESAEVKLRAQQVIASIGDELNAGPAVDGYQLRLRMSANVNADNEELITFDLKLCNLTDKDLPDLRVADVESEINDQREHAQDMKKELFDNGTTSVKAKVILTPLNGQLIEHWSQATRSMDMADTPLAPGEKRVSHYTLPKGDSPKKAQELDAADAIREHEVPLALVPGDYAMQIIYTPLEGEAGSKAKALKSNVLRFTVKEP